jgi:hypothetical protein
LHDEFEDLIGRARSIDPANSLFVPLVLFLRLGSSPAASNFPPDQENANALTTSPRRTIARA